MCTNFVHLFNSGLDIGKNEQKMSKTSILLKSRRILSFTFLYEYLTTRSKSNQLIIPCPDSFSCLATSNELYFMQYMICFVNINMQHPKSCTIIALAYRIRH